MQTQIEKYFLGELTAGERVELLRNVRSDKATAAAFTACQNTYALLAISDAVIDAEESRQSYRQFAKAVRAHRIRRITLRVAAYAAAVALLIAAVRLYDAHTAPTAPSVAETTLFVPAGQRVSVTLDDGTQVWLNAQTRLTYPNAFTAGERRVSVEGEAFFDVAHDAEKPFIVATRGIEMQVLGTTFNVYSYPQEDVSRISLLSGSLRVYTPGAPRSESITLSPSEEMTIRNNRLSPAAAIPDMNYFLWTEGIYSFENETLANIVKKLELYYDIRIEVNDATMLQWKYTVKFRQRDGIDEILRLMRKIHTFSIRKEDEQNRIIMSK
jgi:ferric-dicitrate binding protein FerR (iron transport regulator)